MPSATTHRRDTGRSSKPRASRKRSTSSTFASLFASLTSFSGSSTSDATSPEDPKPMTPTRRAAKSPSHAAGGVSRDQEMTRRRTSKSSTPSTKAAESKSLVKVTSASKAVTKPAQQQKVTPVRSIPRPDVFAYYQDLSTPPTPRPHGGGPHGPGLVGERPTERSYANGNIASPTPRRPLIVPKSGASASSTSDSTQSESDDDTLPDTPTPTQAQTLAAQRSLERLTGQDAVGRSIRSDDFYKRVGRNQVTPPPEAPMPPGIRSQSYRQDSSTDDPQSSPSFSFPDSPGMFMGSGNPSSSYPTPPLDTRTGLGISASELAPAVRETQLARQSGSKELAERQDVHSNESDSLPRQYRILTQSTIKRTEMIIDDLEAELRSLDIAAPPWQREQLLMRLSNTLIMHHRLVDIWSKISQLNRLTVTKVEDREKIEAVWRQLRQQYSHRSQVNGLGVDKFISGVVNDLVNVGEQAQITAKEDGDKAATDMHDLRVVMILLGLVVVFLLLRDETFQKFTIAAGVLVGIYTLLHNSRFRPTIER